MRLKKTRHKDVNRILNATSVFALCSNCRQVHGISCLSLDVLCWSAVEKEKQNIYNFRRAHL